MTDSAPKLFISYSWSSPEHEEWVIALATQLRESGVDVILDKWDLKEGNDAYAFMEKMVTDPEIKKVALICDRIYTEKADGRSGGVGTETQIITPEVYSKQDQNKFVAIIAERNERGNPFLPAYYKSRIYIDLSISDSYEAGFEQFLRWAFDKPLYPKPSLGEKPGFLGEGAFTSLETSFKWRRALDAVRQNRPYCNGALIDYFETFSLNLEKFRISIKEGEFDDQVVHNIESFLPYRNEAIELFLALAQYRQIQETWEAIHRFFEHLMNYLDRPVEVRQWQEWDFDNLRFMVHELFLYAITALLRYECFSGVGHLTGQQYYPVEPSEENSSEMVSFSRFRRHLEIMEYRNKRLKLNRLSLHADLIKQRSQSSGLSFQHVMQTDFVLFLRDCFDCLRGGGRQHWWPITLLYAGHQYYPYEIFARCTSARYFDKVKQMLQVTGKEDLAALAEAFNTRKLYVPDWQGDSFNPLHLMNFDKLASQP